MRMTDLLEETKGDTMRSATMIKYVLLLSTLLGAGHAMAQTTPLIPYNGRLEQAGRPASGPHDFRFALFTAENEAAGCLVTDSEPAQPCGLWWTQFDSVEVRGGAFSVLLGQTPHPLTPTVLAQQELWLAMAVKVHSAPAFTLLKSKQRITEVPRSAAARDFTVSGTLNVDGKIITKNSITTQGDIINIADDGQLGASKNFVFRDSGDSLLHLRSGAAVDGGTSPAYANLAVGMLQTAAPTNIRGMQVSAEVGAAASTWGEAYQEVGTVPAPPGYTDPSKSICFLTRAAPEAQNDGYTVADSSDHGMRGDCRVELNNNAWRLVATAHVGHEQNEAKVWCAMRCMHWDW